MSCLSKYDDFVLGLYLRRGPGVFINVTVRKHDTFDN
jgi:hypothetical protein